MYTGTKKRERSMKSWRLNSVALTWLQGGHHTAPQYRNSGLLSDFAARNAPSTSSLRQAMPSACPADSAAETLGPGAAGAAAARGFGGSVGCGQAARTSDKPRTSRRGGSVMGEGRTVIDDPSVPPLAPYDTRRAGRFMKLRKRARPPRTGSAASR